MQEKRNRAVGGWGKKWKTAPNYGSELYIHLNVGINTLRRAVSGVDDDDDDDDHTKKKRRWGKKCYEYERRSNVTIFSEGGRREGMGKRNVKISYLPSFPCSFFFFPLLTSASQLVIP